MSALTDYADAATVLCPRCAAKVGSPCTVRACRAGRPNCGYKVCAYRKELSEPHLERVVAARAYVEAAVTEAEERARREALTEAADAIARAAQVWEADGTDPCMVRCLRVNAVTPLRAWADGSGSPANPAQAFRLGKPVRFAAGGPS